tara:strand:- start:23 stop:502 length:480 start_codon:yes stop_codon:yes gene_type:complete
MNVKKTYLLLFLLLIVIFIFFLLRNYHYKNKAVSLEPITINLLTSVHPNLSWSFNSLKSKIFIKPGEVTTIEYMVENLGDNQSIGVATFQYFPKQYGNYISKINCFCYDAKTLKPNEKSKYTLAMFIDPEATKDNKTKNVKEITIQFTFFDYKEYKKIN